MSIWENPYIVRIILSCLSLTKNCAVIDEANDHDINCVSQIVKIVNKHLLVRSERTSMQSDMREHLCTNVLGVHSDPQNIRD